MFAASVEYTVSSGKRFKQFPLGCRRAGVLPGHAHLRGRFRGPRLCGCRRIAVRAGTDSSMQAPGAALGKNPAAADTSLSPGRLAVAYDKPHAVAAGIELDHRVWTTFSFVEPLHKVAFKSLYDPVVGYPRPVLLSTSPWK